VVLFRSSFSSPGPLCTGLPCEPRFVQMTRPAVSLALLVGLGWTANKLVYADVVTERVSLEFAEGSGTWRVTSSTKGTLGADGTIRGAGGQGYIETARNSGADALRTWGAEVLDKVLPDAEANGLRVSAGLWMPHSAKFYKECSDLTKDAFWRSEIDRYVTAVRQFKNSSAILWWTVGNEQELEVDVSAGNECVWKRLEQAIQAVKAEDPNHPIGTVLAGVAEPKVRAIEKYSPSVEFLGVNSYGDDALEVGPKLRKWNWTKPFAIMEFGPSGHWASPVTEFGSYVEESSTQKVPRYNATCYSCAEDGQCIGSFAFVWGWKWEKTGTWYNMFNEWKDVTENVTVECPNCESEVMATLEKCWTGKARADLPPSIHGVEVEGEVLPDMSFTVPKKDAVTLEVNATHPLGKEMVAIWAATEEIVSEAIGGAFEATNPLLTGLWEKDPKATTTAGLSVSLNTSDLTPGSMYRLYVFVRQDPASCKGTCHHQEAVASLAFYICHTTQPGDACYGQVAYAMQTGIHAHPQTYPGVTAKSSLEEFQVLLSQKGSGFCPLPCGIRDWCATSVPGEECYGHVRWAMEYGLKQNPELYPWYLQKDGATFEVPSCRPTVPSLLLTRLESAFRSVCSWACRRCFA